MLCTLLHQSVYSKKRFEKHSKWCHYFHPGKKKDCTEAVFLDHTSVFKPPSCSM